MPVLTLPAARLDGFVGSFAGRLLWTLYAFPLYGLIAAVVLGRLRGCAPRSYWTIAVFAPVIFLGAWYTMAVIFSIIIGVVSGEWSEPFFPHGVDFPATVLAIGYFYVGVAWLLYSAADRMGWLSDPA